MEVFKTIGFIADDPSGEVLVFDTVEYEGHWWLVPSWLQPPDGRPKFPEWLVRPLSGYQEGTEPQGRIRFSLSAPIPRSALSGELAAGFEVRSGLPLEQPPTHGPKTH